MTYAWQTDPESGKQFYETTLADGTVMKAGEYAQRRMAAYPTLADQVDALWKILEIVQAGGAPAAWPPDALAVMAARNAVKAAIPKPDVAPPWVKG